jgi:iron complex outermembrane receptor protein
VKLTVGARASTERKAGRSVVTYSIVDPNLFPGDATYSHTWRAFTPKATLTFQPSSHFMAYLTAAKGFKSGGYDLSGSSAGVSSATVDAALSRPFDQETVWNYEVGEKLTGLGDRLVFDADVFDDEYHNLQTSQLVVINGVPIPLTSNAGNARVAGVELESQFLPTNWLTLGLAYSYMDAHFTAKNTGFTGARIPYAPKDQVHASVDLHFPLPGDGGRISLAADYTYHSKVFFDNANTAPPFLQSRSIWRGVVNGHIEYDSPGDVWRLSVWGKNLTGTEPALHAADVTVLFEDLNEFLGNAGSIFLAKYYPVRTFGVTLSRRF